MSIGVMLHNLLTTILELIEEGSLMPACSYSDIWTNLREELLQLFLMLTVLWHITTIHCEAREDTWLVIAKPQIDMLDTRV